MGYDEMEYGGSCSICRQESRDAKLLADGKICPECSRNIPWECKTMRYPKGVGLTDRFAEKYILHKMTVREVKECIGFVGQNAVYANLFQETGCLPDSGMVYDFEHKLFYFDMNRAALRPELKEALLAGEGPRIVFKAEWVESFRLDYGYYKMPGADGSMLYHPQYAQVVILFRHQGLKNKSVRLDVDKPCPAELLLRKHYSAAAEETLRTLECLTELMRGGETKTYYE